MAKKTVRKIPQFKVVFTNTGDLCEGGGDWLLSHPNFSSNYKTEDNAPFTDTFEYTGYHGAAGGNSRILFQSVKTGRKVSMFMSDFDEVIQSKRFIDNQIVGLFCYCRKYIKQGIRLILDDAP
jgi:hypothetical protein